MSTTDDSQCQLRMTHFTCSDVDLITIHDHSLEAQGWFMLKDFEKNIQIVYKILKKTVQTFL